MVMPGILVETPLGMAASAEQTTKNSAARFNLKITRKGRDHGTKLISKGVQVLW